MNPHVKSLGEIMLEVAQGEGAERVLTVQEVAGIKRLLNSGLEQICHLSRPCGCGFISTMQGRFQVTACPNHGMR
jgi:hypothetical protein